MNKEYTKNCPKCGEIMGYSTHGNLNTSIKNNTFCEECRFKETRNREYTKNCPQCGKLQEYKSNQSFNHSIRNNCICNECRVKNSRKTEEEKKLIAKKRKEYKKIYIKEYSKRPEVILRKKEYNKQRKKKPDFYIKQREYDRKRRNNPTFKMNDRMSTGIRKSLKFNTLSKNGRHWEDIVGYTVQELRKHLEKLFKPGMSWDNYKDWEIDHIIPRSFFKFSSTNDVEFRYCWSLDNLQPLWENDNIIKGDKVILWGKKINAKDII